jgi:hypothetical protein
MAVVHLERVAGIEPAYSAWKADVFLNDFNARFHTVFFLPFKLIQPTALVPWFEKGRK